MTLTIPEFWQLVVASGLHDEAECRRLADAFGRARDEGQVAKTVSLPEWMLAEGAMTLYQAKILLAGKPGPFVYGDYLITHRAQLLGLPNMFRAVHRPTGVTVGLVFLAGRGLADPAVVYALENRAAATAAITLSTPFLTHCYTLADLGTYKFFVVDAPPSDTLASVLADGKITAKDAVRIVCELAQGLSTWHEAGHAHGDVRPQNVWIDKARCARLAIFPLARDPLSEVGANVAMHVDPAAIDYCAPEATEGAHATPASDIYSLGCLVYQLLAGEVPFPEGDAEARLAHHGSTLPRPLNEIKSKMPAPLVALVAKMLAKKPADRFQNATTLLAALLPLATKLGAAPAPSAAPGERDKLAKYLAANRPATDPADSAAVAVTATDDIVDFKPRAPATRARPRYAAIAAGAITALVIAAAGAGGRWYFTAPKSPHSTTQIAQNTPAAPIETVAPPAPAASNDENQPPADVRPTQPTPSPQAPPPETVVGIEAPMWISPTGGAPLELRYLVSSADVILVLRPADLLRHPDGQKLLDPRTLGPLASFLTDEVAALTATPLADIDRLTIGVMATEGETPQWALVAEIAQPKPAAELLAAWGNPEAADKDGIKHFRDRERAYFLPTTTGPTQTIVVGPAEAIIDDVIPSGGAPAALSQELEALLPATDAERHFTAIARTRKLVAHSAGLMPGVAASLREPLQWLLDGSEPGAAAPTGATNKPGSQTRIVDISSHGLPLAVLTSAHLGDEDLFLEVRTLTDPNRPAALLARELRERVLRLPKLVNQNLRAIQVSDYSRDILGDYPLMLEQLARYTVAGTDRRQVVLRAYLPSAAAHNLALASMLAIYEQGGPAAPADATAARPVKNTAAAAAGPQLLAQRLDRPISLAGRLTLEAALQQIGDELGVPVDILGPDLQAEGITKNQSFTLAENDRPAGEILRKVMLQANPDGKLIYVVRASPAGDGETLCITTRSAAAQRGEKIPAELADNP